MVQKLEGRGLCGTCIYRSDCLSLKNTMKEGNQILHCEEFDDSECKTEGERWCLPNNFATLPCITVKDLIPGWKS